MLKSNRPEVLIIGVMKSGTTSIHSYLRQCTEFSVSKPKEPNYLSFNNYNLSEEDYINLFEDKTKLNVESSVSYFQYIPFIDFDPNQKIIISFRDPVERIFSHYKMNCSELKYDKSFSEYLKENYKLLFNDKVVIDFISNPLNKDHNPSLIQSAKNHFNNPLIVGYYASLVNILLAKHPKENIKIVSFEEFQKNEKETMIDILKFVGVKDLSTFTFEKEKQNPGFYFDNKATRKFFETFRKIKVFSQKFLTRDFPFVKIAMKLEAYLLNKFNKKIEMNSTDRSFLTGYYKEKNIEFKNLLDKHGFDSSFVDKWQ